MMLDTIERMAKVVAALCSADATEHNVQVLMRDLRKRRDAEDTEKNQAAESANAFRQAALDFLGRLPDLVCKISEANARQTGTRSEGAEPSATRVAQVHPEQYCGCSQPHLGYPVRPLTFEERLAHVEMSLQILNSAARGIEDHVSSLAMQVASIASDMARPKAAPPAPPCQEPAGT